MDRLGIRKSSYQKKKNMVGDIGIKQLSKISESDEWNESALNSPIKEYPREPDSN